MSTPLTNIMNKIDSCLDQDLSILDRKINLGDKKGFASHQKQRREFVKYLSSVATHPIGLHASVKPYNCRQEDMLLYLMDMFELSEPKLRAIMIGKSAPKLKQKDDQSPIRMLKRHSWRPELKLRIHPPAFFYKEKLFLDNLYVRIFLITEEKEVSPELDIDLSNIQDSKCRGMFRKIFKKLHSSSSNRIRPLNEVEQVVKFGSEDKILDQSSIPSKSNKLDYKTTRLIDDRERVTEDIHLKIRRYYCDPQSPYMLRFEFWLNSDILNLGCIRRYQRYMKQLVSGSFSRCSKANDKLAHLYRNQEFYGSINIKLSNLPSYAVKQKYPILSLHEKRVNNCEISVELKNRRILGESATEDEWLSPNMSGPAAKKSIESFLINHVRLCFNCILYQCLTLLPDTYHKLAETGRFGNITLDNLLYLAGYTLLNQHRLQSNLSRFEDQSLRRVAILMLLIKLENRPFDESQTISDLVKVLLISLVQNEYTTANKLIDDKTLQEVDPFQNGSSISTTKKIINEIELKSLNNFLKMFLIPKLDQWLPKLYEDSSVETTNRTIILMSLKLFKTALVQLRKMNKSYEDPIDSNTNIMRLKSSIEQYLCKIIIYHIQMRMETIILSEEKPMRLRKFTRARQSKLFSPKIEDDNLWLQLLHDIRYIQHDLTLYWSRKGLGGLIEHEKTFVKRQCLFDKLEKKNLSSIIEAKLETYLKDRENE